MGLYVSKDLESNSKLNARIVTNLQNRAIAEERAKLATDALDDPEKTTKTKKFSWFWLILSGLAGVSLALIVFL